MERVLEIKEQIEAAKTKQAGIKGQIKEIESQMSARFKVTNTTEAEKKLEKIGIELDKLNQQFTEKLEQLEDVYIWD